MYVQVNVNKPAKANVGAGGDKKDMLVMIRKDDVLTMPSRDSKGVLITGDIVMKPGKYMTQVYGTVSTIGKGFTTEGDPDARGFLHNVTFSHPGDSLEILEFIQNNMNHDFFIIVQKCSSNDKRLLGTDCAGLRLGVEATDNNEMNNNVFTFEPVQKSQAVPSVYEGALTLAEPVGIFAADDATPSVGAGEGEYQTTGSALANVLTTLDDPVDGGLYTLIGSSTGAVAPSIDAGADFLLKNGTSYTLSGGTRITFRAFKDGASTFKFIEQSRT